MATSDKGKFVDDDNQKGKSMMSLDEDKYFKKVTPLAEEIMDDIDWYTDEMRKHAEKGLGGGGCLMEYMGVVAETEDGDKGTEVMKDKVFQEHICEEEVPLNNNIRKLSGDLVEMPSEAVEQGMDDHVPDEIDGVKGDKHSDVSIGGRKGNLEFLVCIQVPNHGGDELVDKQTGIKHCKTGHWFDPKLENERYKSHLYEIHLLLDPSQREELENKVRRQEELVVL
ncbi:hypothetical protein Tco_0414821 [Tanacetum coccineum]